MNTIDVLRQAKAILSDETRWCRRGSYALDDNGWSVATTDPAAVSFCALGAIAHAAGLNATAGVEFAYETPAAKALRDAVPSVGVSFIWWNDKRATHAQMIDAFDRAILSLSPETKPEPVPERAEVSA